MTFASYENGPAADAPGPVFLVPLFPRSLGPCLIPTAA
jgi:hypothetical protein